MNYKILIADDEPEIRDLLRLYLEKDGYIVNEAADGIDAVEQFQKDIPDLVILDIMMPKMDGYRVLKKVRESSNVPVIMLSAKGADADKILGLDLGADDYLTKPFNPLEAVARIRSNIRRFYSLGAKSEEKENCVLTVQDMVLDTDSCEFTVGGKTVDLTGIEYRLMQLLMANPGKVYTKQQLFEEGWEENYVVADNNIMVCISKLRAKLSEDPNRYIKTIRGLGYRLDK